MSTYDFVGKHLTPSAERSFIKCLLKESHRNHRQASEPQTTTEPHKRFSQLSEPHHRNHTTSEAHSLVYFEIIPSGPHRHRNHTIGTTKTWINGIGTAPSEPPYRNHPIGIIKRSPPSEVHSNHRKHYIGTTPSESHLPSEPHHRNQNMIGTIM